MCSSWLLEKAGRVHYYYTPKARKSTLLLHTKSQEEHITTTHQKPGRTHYYYTPKAVVMCSSWLLVCSSNVLFLAFGV
jgi:N-acetyl-beta-hexosaminidase